jgi:hypothetical protein
MTSTRKDTPNAAGPSSRSKEIFYSTLEENQELIKAILKDERDLQHMKKRPEIHSKIYDHVKRLVK